LYCILRQIFVGCVERIEMRATYIGLMIALMFCVCIMPALQRRHDRGLSVYTFVY